MKNIYVTFSLKWLDNWHNDSRYTLQYFIDNDFTNFIATKFPQYVIGNYKQTYSLEIQEVYNDTQGFAVVSFDNLTTTETKFLLWIKDIISFMNITKRTATYARNWLTNNWYKKISETKFEVFPEYTLNWETYPAVYINL